MKKLRVLGVFIVLALAALGIWVARTSSRPAETAASSDTGSAYDYEASDVVVRQMGPNGDLQYELAAKRISQLPRNGEISAHDLVMHRDPVGGAPDEAHRWTLTANRAVLPESGTAITLEGNVHAQGRLQKSPNPIEVAAEQLTYNMETQDLLSSKPVYITWGRTSLQSETLHMNIKGDSVAVDSELHGTFTP